MSRSGKKIFIYCAYGSEKDMKQNKDLLLNTAKFNNGELIYSSYGRPARISYEFIYQLIEKDVQNSVELFNQLLAAEYKDTENKDILVKVFRKVFGGNKDGSKQITKL